MKKSYLMIAAVVTLFAACSDKEEIKQISSQGPAIGFTTYYQKATKAENSSESYDWDLSNHHSDFKVWGYKNTSATAVFDGEQVWWETNLDPDAWTYTNNRYWDKVADDYYFYACAPYTGTPFSFNGVTSVATQPDGYFTIGTSYTKAGENVSAYAKSTANTKVASEDMVESWTAAGAATDVDLMIAEPKHMEKGTSSLVYNDPVQLNFIHILSRLNITVKTVTGFNPEEANDDIIVVDNITIGNMKKSGTFSENTSVTHGTLATGTYDRWTTAAVANDAEYSYDLDYTADLTKKYVIEALMLPQVLGVEEVKADGSDIANKTKPYLYIEYTIWNHAKTAGQTYKAYYNLATILTVTTTNTTAAETAFNEGWQNNIYITIDPDKIDFEAKVAKWATTKENDLIVE